MQLKIPCDFTDVEPKPNNDPDRPELHDVHPLCIIGLDGRKYYPKFQRDPRTKRMYKNVASCIRAARENSGNKIHDIDIIMWFLRPNSALEGKTPVEVGRHPDKEVRNRIAADALEMDLPLNGKVGW